MECGHRRPEPNQFVVDLDPSTGTRLILNAHRADATGALGITLDMEFAEEDGEAPTPYEVLPLDAMKGDSSRSTRVRTRSRDVARGADAAGRAAPGASLRARVTGPGEADRLVAAYGGWHGPWIAG